MQGREGGGLKRCVEKVLILQRVYITIDESEGGHLRVCYTTPHEGYDRWTGLW